MDILVIHTRLPGKRRSLNDHLYSFKRYAPAGYRFYYLDVQSEASISDAVINYPFDAVIFHYTFLARRFDGMFPDTMLQRLSWLRGIKVMIPHDEFYYPAALRQLINACDIKIVFTSCSKRDFDIIFPPEKFRNKVYSMTVFTGYVEESLIRKYRRLVEKTKERPVDIGYRALKSYYRFGSHGQIKEDVAVAFLDELKMHPGVRHDISINKTTGHALKGDKWLQFLASCRTVLGCLAGSSVIDEEGLAGKRIQSYLKEHKNATFEEVRENCYTGSDGEISAFMIGPRHFESALTRTCQLLVEGDYQGVLEPGVDYIEIKRDFSNVSDVLKQVSDAGYCKRIADQCYEHVVGSGKYTYRGFVKSVLLKIFAFYFPQEQPQRFALMRFRLRAKLVRDHVVRILRYVLLSPKILFYFLTNQFSERNPRLYFAIKHCLFPGKEDTVDAQEVIREKEKRGRRS